MLTNKIKKYLLISSIMLGSFLGVIIVNTSNAEAATVYIPMSYNSPSPGLLNAYKDRPGTPQYAIVGPATTSRGILNERYSESLSPGARNFIRRVFSAEARFNIPPCASGLSISMTGLGGSGGQSVSFRGYSGPRGSEGAFYPPTYDWPEARADIWSNSNGTGLLATSFAPALADIGPGDTVTFSSSSFSPSNVYITPADLSNGITFSFWVETFDQLSNQGLFGIGRQWSFNLTGSPFLRVTYNTDSCPSFNLNANIDIDRNTGDVDFSSYNSGNGASRFSDGAGARVIRQVWVNGAPQLSGSNNTSREIINPSANWQDNWSGASVLPGDVICAELTVGPRSGLTDFAVFSEPPSPLTNQYAHQGGLNVNCVTNVAKPYLRVYGGDVVTGLDFQASDGTCSGIKDTTAGINAHSRNAGGNLVGAGSQFATSAAGQIVSFISAANHNGAASTNTRPFKDLMFSNTTSGNYGNDIGAYSGCLPDYSKLMDTTGGASSYTPGSTIAANSSGGIRRYHEGNLDITGDITLLPSQTIDADNGFVNIIIVKGGDIRIAPVVTQIDALLVAIPDDSGNGGTIDTCYLSTVATGGPCVNKLTINGSLVANKIEFDRLGGDLRDAGSDETPGSGSIAEVINYPAYLNFVFTGLVENSVPAASSPLNIGDYDSIAELPPVL